LTATMNPEDASSDDQFRHYFRLMRNFRAKHSTIKGDRTRQLFCPDNIFQFLNTHA
jgi:hypothetical protein